jgi:hypothetical protein
MANRIGSLRRSVPVMKINDAVRMPLLCGLDGCGNATALARKLLVFFLPLRWAVRGRDLDRRHFVLGSVGGPVRIFGGHDVGLCVRMMERRIDHARCYAFGDERA